MVTKNICESVPKTKDITAEVETCIQTPKEVGFLQISIQFLLSIHYNYRYASQGKKYQQNTFVKE